MRAGATCRSSPSKESRCWIDGTGQHGLIAELGWNRGLLLPQVPVDWKWDAQEFLINTCNKAGLPLTAYMEKGFKLYCFEAQIFREESPRGKIAEHRIC